MVLHFRQTALMLMHGGGGNAGFKKLFVILYSN